MKMYRAASEDVVGVIARLREQHYAKTLEPVTIGALFVFDDEDDVPVLTHRGYPAAALVRIVGVRDRAAGMPDAQIVVDRNVYAGLTARQRQALLDHELHHLEPIVDKAGHFRPDSQGRPRLRMRRHDWQFGWFDEIAKRYGADSLERMEAKQLMEQSGQLYFPFDDEDQAAA